MLHKYLSGLHEDAVEVFAFEVRLALDRSIVLAIGLVQNDADPVAFLELRLADVRHLACTLI